CHRKGALSASSWNCISDRGWPEMTLAAAACLLQCPSKKQPSHVAYRKHCLVLVLTGQIIGNAYAETE
ncbi:MAG: hypothetical protein LUQ06_06875, partial [Methylococcaceae bacterium]|nr:hypothetical protein [Methylococcaceae bacterium]